MTDSESVLFCVKLSRLKAVVQVSSGGYLGKKGWRDFFPLFCTHRIQNGSVMQSSLSLKVTVLQKHKYFI